GSRPGPVAAVARSGECTPAGATARPDLGGNARGPARCLHVPATHARADHRRPHGVGADTGAAPSPEPVRRLLSGPRPGTRHAAGYARSATGDSGERRGRRARRPSVAVAAGGIPF